MRGGACRRYVYSDRTVSRGVNRPDAYSEAVRCAEEALGHSRCDMEARSVLQGHRLKSPLAAAARDRLCFLKTLISLPRDRTGRMRHFDNEFKSPLLFHRTNPLFQFR